MNPTCLKPSLWHAAGLLLGLLLCNTAMAQQPGVKMIPDTSKMTYNEISNRMKFYVFPSKGQTQQQQKEDEFECYNWAIDQSGIDPMNMPEMKTAPVQTGPDGTAIKTAAVSTAMGAAVGAITGNAGEGAAIGATIGAFAGVRKKIVSNQQAQQQAEASAAAQEKALQDSFKKAFSVCMEGKGYTIK